MPSACPVRPRRVQTRQAAALMDQRIVVGVDAWDSHSIYPTGHYVRALGKIGEKDTETVRGLGTIGEKRTETVHGQ